MQPRNDHLADRLSVCRGLSALDSSRRPRRARRVPVTGRAAAFAVEALERRAMLSVTLVTAYDFDEAGGDVAVDSSPTGNDGQLSAAGVTRVAGVSGGALSFDGVSGKVTAQLDLDQWLGRNGSLAVWIKTTAAGNNTFFNAPGVTGVEQAGGPNDIFWGWIDATGHIAIQSDNGAPAKSVVAINDGSWHHVAFTRNQTTGQVRTYVDGVLSAQATDDSLFRSTPFFDIGSIGDTGGTPTFFNGELDQLRIYRGVLSDAEVAGLANRTEVAPTPPGPRAQLGPVTVAPSQVNEGDSVTLTSSFADSRPDQARTFTIDWGDGTTSSVTAPALGTPTMPLTKAHYFGGHEYFAIDVPGLTWEEAEAEAVRVGGHLATIRSAAENQFIVDMIRSEFDADEGAWVGFTDNEAFGGTEFGNTSALPLPAPGQVPTAGERGAGFVWVNGEPFDYQHWRGGEPNNNNAGHEQDFGWINFRAPGDWDDLDDAQAHDVIRTAIIEIDTTFTATHTYADDNPTGTASDVNTVTVTMTDSDGEDHTGTADVTVDDVAPVITSLASSSPECGGAAEGQAVTVSGTFTDVGVQDTHTAVIDWGDGTTSAATISESGGSGTLSGSHAYAVGGVYPITVKLTDDDTLSAIASSQAVVSGVGVRNGTLYVIGTEDADHVTINQQGDGTYVVHANFLAGNRLVSGAGVTNIVVVLCDGDDHFSMAGSISTPALIDGGEGNDQLNGGNGRNVILGGPGDDVLIGGSDKDLLIGGTGADRIIGNKGNDALVGATTSADGNYAVLGGFFTGLFDLNGVGKQDDGVRDVLTGSAGIDTFVVSDEDVITDQAEVEIFV
jgi:hypothetical protein